ncbi:hypothetical protein ES708_14588 [subsurface metagenome]
MADDLGYGDLGCYGSEKIKTPNIDRIAGEGVMFSDAHSPAAVCTPTRYAILTGRYCWRSRLKKEVLWDGYTRSLIEPGRNTIAKVMKTKGYKTAQIGKWHLRKDLGPSVIDVAWKPCLVDSIYTVKAIKFITEHVQTYKKKPFYLHLTPEAPHLPNNVPDFLKRSSKAGQRGDHVQMFDWMVGEIDKTLHDLKIDDKTLIVITSDNGAVNSGYDHKSCGDLRGYKGSRWEGGHRIPLIIKWDGNIDPGTKNDGLICLVDMMATFSHIVGYELESGMGEDSFDALPMITGKRDEVRKSLVMHDYQGRFAIRKGNWKLVDEELYNLETDLAEKNNVAAEYPDVVRELKALLKKQQDDGFTVRK